MKPPEEAEYRDWLGHPVTEWVLARMASMAAQQKTRWAELAWEKGEVDPLLLCEARVRADCYRAIPDSTYDDWKALHDSEA